MLSLLSKAGSTPAAVRAGKENRDLQI